MKKMNVKKFARTFLVLIAVFALACAFSSMAFAADGETAAAALTEDPKSFGKALIFVVLGEGIALYGMLIAILIITKF